MQIRITLTRAECVASAEVQMGRTRVRSTVSGEIVVPFADRPSEGSIAFAADISPMAMPTEEVSTAKKKIAFVLLSLLSSQ